MRAIPRDVSADDFVNITLSEPAMKEITPDPQQPPAPAASPQQQQEQQQQQEAPAQRVSEAGGSTQEGLASFLGLFGNSSPPAGEQASAGGASGEDPIKELEVAAAKVADQARHAADQARHAAKAASMKLKEGASELAANLTSWWSSLEPGNQFSLGPGAPSQSKHQDYAAIQEALGLDNGEAVLESFKCSLLQTYTCANNPFTPDRQVAFGGELHITSQRVCFVVASENGVVPIKLDIKSILKVKKEKAEGGLPERLVLSLSKDERQSMVLSKFSLKELEMDSALALLEHLTTE